jgi:hypothetical protein
MEKTLAVKIRELQELRVGELRKKYAELFGEETGSHNKPQLIKRIAYRLQELADGSLSRNARAGAPRNSPTRRMSVRAYRPMLSKESTRHRPPSPSATRVYRRRARSWYASSMASAMRFRSSTAAFSTAAHAIARSAP